MARAASPPRELSAGRFQPLLADPLAAAAPAAVRRVVLCSGKLYYELLEQRERRFAGSAPVALLRVEQLYPWPGLAIARAVEAFPAVDRVVWAQEEPANMGAWSFARERLHDVLRADQVLAYAGRSESASPAAGSLRIHRQEQAALIDAALS